MAANALSLLFELDADGHMAVDEFKRVRAAFAAEIEDIKKLAASTVKLSLVESTETTRAGDGAAASKATVDSQREVNRQLEEMWAAREKEQAASSKKQADVDRAFANQQIATAKDAENQIAQAYKDRESQAAKTAKQSEDAWAKHEAAKLAATRQAEKEGESVVAAANTAKEKAAKTSSDNFLKQQKQTAALVARANAQTAADEIRNALIAAKGTADVSSIASRGIDSLGNHLNLLIGNRIPLAGGAFVRLSENVRGFITLSKESEGSVLRLGNLIADLSTKTGKSAPQIKDFLTSFSKLGSQVEKDEAAIGAFGPALAQKLTPQLAAADSEMTALAASTGETGGAFAALAGPVGVAVLAVAAVVAVTAAAINKMFEMAEATAKFEGKFVDLNQQTGISVELLSAFDVLASTTDTDIGALSSSFGIFQKHLEEAQDPMSESAGLLGELGIQTRDTESALRQTFATLGKMPEGFRQTAVALQLFGRGGKSVLAIIKETNGDLDKAIARFRELGLIVSDQDAKAADKFNDELELLDRQTDAITRQLGREFLPAALEIVTALSELINASKGIFDLIGLVGKPVLDTFADQLRAVSLVIALIRHDAEATAKIIKDLNDREDIAPISVPDVTPVALPTGEESALKKAGEESRLIKAEVAEAIRFAETQMAEIDRQLRLREISPAQALEPVIALEKSKTEAVIKGLEARRDAATKAFTKDEKDREKQRNDIQDLDKQIADEQTRFEKFEADKRAESRAKQLSDEQEHRRRLLDVFIQAANDQIAAISRSAQTGRISQLAAADATTEIIKTEFKRRRDLLKQELQEAGADASLQNQINDQLKSLETERTAVLREQSARREDILREEAKTTIETQLATAERILRVGQIVDQSRIAALNFLAAARVKSEEDVARATLKIRLDALQREDDVIRARVTATKTIADPNERARSESKLNDELKVNQAQREAIQNDGNRNIDEARKRDVQNEQKYADDLKAIQRDIADAVRDNQRLILELMTERPARQILAKRIALEQADEDARHKRALDSIVQQRRENAESNRTQEERGAKTAELNRRAEVEEERHRLELKKIHDDESRDLERLDSNSKRSLFGEIFADAVQAIRDSAAEAGVAVSDLTVIIGAFGAAAEEHFANASAQAGNFISILLEGIDQINAGLADMLENWILTGETGSAAFRKLLASTLAYYAKTFLIKALDNVAEGFSNLAKASAAAAAGDIPASILYHDAAIKNFISAAKYGLAAAGTAVAGRLVAGNSFKQEDTASRAVNGGDSQPNNKTFNLGENGPVESSGRAVQDGSGGIADRLEAIQQQNVELLKRQQAQNAVIIETMARLKAAKPGDVVTMGASDARQAIGVAVIDHSNSSGDFNETLQRNLGLA